MAVDGSRVALLIEDVYEDLEFWYPFYRLKEAGCEVTVVGTGKEGYSGKNGLAATEDASIDDVSPADFDAVVIPGGYAPDRMRRRPEMVDLVREMDARGAVVAAICHAGWMLASAGVVEGRTVTSFFAIEDDLVNAGAEWVDREVVRDGNLITSRTPDDLPAFLRTILDALGGA